MLICLGMAFDLAAKCFQKAMSQTGTSLKYAALSMGLDPAQLRRQLDGHEHLSMRRVFDGMPHPFIQYFALNLVSEAGLPSEISTAVLIHQQMENAS